VTAGEGGRRRAAFVDRDGTVILERDYLADPAGVELLPGAAAGLSRLRAAGYEIVLISNQSGIARGLYGESDYQAVQAEVVARLAERGVPVLASYHCPHHPDFTGPCECRKPAVGLYLQAAREHGLLLEGSAYIGDRLRDVEPARELGGVAVLVRTGYGAREAAAAADWVRVVDDLDEAAGTIIATMDGR
jgi:D-glycero-D-manno-heptose 1,7-bisphosphate phosphatase